MRSQFCAKGDLYRLLSALEATAGDFVTVYVEPACFPDYIDRLWLDPKYSTYVDEIKVAVNAEAVIRGVRKYGTGVTIFWNGDGNKHVVLPSFPISENKISTGKLDTSVLRKALERRHVIGVVLVTWGSYAIGVFDDGNLVESKIGTGFIHKEHRKGGRSERRFARRTEEQKKDFLRRVGNRIEERFGGFTLDHIFFGGNRLIARPLSQECKYLQSRTRMISPRILDVRYADREALVNTLVEITKSLAFSF
ncbi:MAG TPA: hypothetical protein G4O12_05855 [Dehalococcoidia bacterium]|nr:hypothetical protein [Dehalococcoidia bacterium]